MNWSAGRRLWVQLPRDRPVFVMESCFIRGSGLYKGRFTDDKDMICDANTKTLLQRLTDHRW